jgi:hypothetical protein
VVMSPTQTGPIPRYWPSARHFTEAIQCPSVCFTHPLLRNTLPAVDRLGMPLVTSGQFAYVYKLKSTNRGGDFAVRCFRGYLGDRDQRYRAIQEHLMNSPVAFLSEFSYAPEGILVGGNRFPILFMNWIDGPTLDVYIGDMLNRPDVLLHLSEEWLRLLSALRASGTAHGDLQHGNIIVEHGQLRLVDHDGIFVSKMAGWTASEVGHQHYQHPRREATHFDAELDNFSGLVIYLSLLSLAERPGLWKEHHDENLLFNKTDFANPAQSELFRKIRELGPEHAKLADVLADAATGSPAEVPCLLDLVQTKTGLPSWMTAPANLDTATRTREVVLAEPAYSQKSVRWISWQDRNRGPSIPQTPSSGTVQTIFQGTAAAPVVLDPNALARNTVYYSKDFLRRYFLLWYWAAYVVLKFMGFDFFVSIVVALICLSLACIAFGLAKAIDVSLKANSPNPLTITPPPGNYPKLSQSPSSSWSPHVSLPLSPSNTGVEPFVGNLVLGIYHVQDCDWVTKISDKNRVGFGTSSEAISHGFKPCRICWPSA